MIPLAPVLVLAGALWLLWRVFRAYVLRSPLDNIPGPASVSFLKGTYVMLLCCEIRSEMHSLLGTIPALYNRHGWDYHDSLAKRYGQVFKFYGLLGVRPSTKASESGD